MPAARIIARHAARLSPWVTLVTREVDIGGTTPEIYHGLDVADYVAVLSLTAAGQVPVLRQFRAAIEDFTLELPGGLAEPDEAPAITAARELHEETGLIAAEAVRPLCKLLPDPGRLNNVLWGFFAPLAVPEVSGWSAEPGIEILYWSVAELRAAVRDGRFIHAQHVAMIGAAVLHGLI
jgi:8-oxo-dGTP pyrophosphatase MutT (NUDIX family)